LFGLIALQKKIDGQSLANLDDVPWYGVGPNEPTPIPILGPDIIDPRQMDLIRHQAQLAAQGLPYGVREVPALKPVAPAVPKVAAKAQAAPAATDEDPAKAERLKKREEALARKRAAEGGGTVEPAPVAEAVAVAEPAGEKKKFDKQAMLEKIRQRKAGG
jgi:hypothetical protein